MNLEIPLFADFHLRTLTKEEFDPLYEAHLPVVFAGSSSFDREATMSAAEIEQRHRLEQAMPLAPPWCFGVFAAKEFVGWHLGYQISSEEFYMRNTGILPAYQGRGLYTAMLAPLIRFIADQGFQVISSKHNATNNRVIIPKLRAGFIITAMELSDRFGTMIRLEYLTNAQRRRQMDVRSGLLG